MRVQMTLVLDSGTTPEEERILRDLGRETVELNTVNSLEEIKKDFAEMLDVEVGVIKDFDICYTGWGKDGEETE